MAKAPYFTFLSYNCGANISPKYREFDESVTKAHIEGDSLRYVCTPGEKNMGKVS